MNRLLRPFQQLARGRSWWLHNVTTSGNSILLALIATANAIWGYPLGFLFTTFLVLFLLAGLLNRCYYPCFDVELSAPAEVAQGESLQLVWTLKNLRRVTLYDLQIRFHSSCSGIVLTDEIVVIHSIAPGESVVMTTQAICNKRGIYRWPTIEFASGYPFGIFRSSRKITPSGTLAITPRFLPQRQMQDALPFSTLAGQMLSDQHRGEAFEYLGSRDFISGLSVRRWDFAAWARLGRPIVREFESPRSPQVILWVDTSSSFTKKHLQSSSGTDETLEAIYSLAATIARTVIASNARLLMSLSCDFPVRGVPLSLSSNAQKSAGRPARNRLAVMMRRLAAGTCSTHLQSETSLRDLIAEPGNVDLFIMITGRHDGHEALPDYMTSQVPHCPNVRIFTIDSNKKIVAVRSPIVRRTNSTTHNSTFKPLQKDGVVVPTRGEARS